MHIVEKVGGIVKCELCSYTTAAAHFELHVDHMLGYHDAPDHNEATQMAIKYFHPADR